MSLRPWMALVRKELRQLLPLILGLVAVLLWSELESLVISPPTSIATPPAAGCSTRTTGSSRRRSSCCWA